MTMPTMFLIFTVIMATLALSFLILPLVLRNQKIPTFAWIAAVAIPVFVITLYELIGQQDALDARPTEQRSQLSGTATPAGSGQPSNVGSVGSLVSGLEERLRANPGDAKGWLLLAKSYSHLGQTADAALAYENARDLGQTDADLEAKLGAPDIVEKSAPVIRGRLTIAESAKDQVEPDDAIFIFAKSTGGAAMPLAVLRKTAGDLPIDFELSDKQAMSAAAKLSDASMVTITARVSKSGNAMQSEPGLEVISETITVGDNALIELHLDPTRAASNN